MFEVHVLGTSSARFANNRAVSGTFVMTPRGAILVDCGEGLQQRILDQNRLLKLSGSKTRCRMSKIRAILFTHGHLDHCWGLLPMLHTMALDGRREPLTIIAPTSREAIQWALDNPGIPPYPESKIASTDLAILFSQWQSLGAKDEEFGFDIDWVLLPMESMEPHASPIQPIGGVELTIVPTIHGVPSCAWMIASEQQLGKFNREKSQSLNLNKDEISKLADGENILKNGKQLDSKDFRAPPRDPISVVISGDTTGNVPAFTQLPYPPDLLIHEATFLIEQQKNATMYNHSTTHDAARHAEVSDTGVLALTHYSSRITNTEQVVKEAKEIHRRSVACDDGDLFIITRSGEISRQKREDIPPEDGSFAGRFASRFVAVDEFPSRNN